MRIMEKTHPPEKRIKVEHSYATLLNGISTETVVIKEENDNSFKITDCESTAGTIKIEISDSDLTIKTEPEEETFQNENYSFEYMNVNKSTVRNLNGINQKENQSMVQNIPQIEVENIKTEIETESEIPIETPVASFIEKDPLEIVNSVNSLNNEPDNNLLVPKKAVTPRMYPSERIAKKNSYVNNMHKTLVAKNQPSATVLQLKKENENLQKQLTKLKADLKSTKAKEKALQTELGARRMAEISLQEKNNRVMEELQKIQKEEKLHQKCMADINQQMVHLEECYKAKTEYVEKLKVEFNDRMRTLTSQLSNKTFELKKLTTKHEDTTRTVFNVSSKYTLQKTELETVKSKLKSTEEQLHETNVACQSAKQQLLELQKNTQTLSRNYEELQKSLMTEKKMSRFFIKERDHLLEQQDRKFKEADKELTRLKQSVKVLLQSLNERKEASKAMATNYRRKVAELEGKMEQLKKREEEFKNRTCEYCGF